MQSANGRYPRARVHGHTRWRPMGPDGSALRRPELRGLGRLLPDCVLRDQPGQHDLREEGELSRTRRRCRFRCVWRQRFHVKQAYIHNGWTGDVSRGSDVAMLKLDKSTRLKTPRLFRHGMVIGKKDLLTPGWGIGHGKTGKCGLQSYLSVHRSPRGKCRGKDKNVPEDGWLCFCGNEAQEKTGGRTERPRRISVLCSSRSGRRSSSGGRCAMRC